MFNNLKEDLARYNENPNDEELSKKLAKKRLTMRIVGIILAVLGFGGAIACFVLLMTSGEYFMEHGFTPRLIVPFALVVPSAFIGGIGAMLINVSASITSNVRVLEQAMTDSLGVKCGNCGYIVNKDELFCTKCGKPIKKICPNCGEEYNANNDFCGKCGTKL